MKLTNNSLGPKAITTTDRGVVVLQPGTSDDLNVSENDAAALERFKLLERPEGGSIPSLADLQREIASNTPAAAPTVAGEQDADPNAGLPAADDPDVVALVDANNSQQLQELVADESVDVTGARNKTDTARRIVAKRRAAPPAGEATDDADLPAEDDSDVVALVDGNTEDELRQLAENESVSVTGDDDKTDLARKIVASRRAA